MEGKNQEYVCHVQKGNKIRCQTRKEVKNLHGSDFNNNNKNNNNFKRGV